MVISVDPASILKVEINKERGNNKNIRTILNFIASKRTKNSGQ